MNATGPLNLHLIHFGCAAQAEVHAHVAGAGIAHGSSYTIPLRLPICDEANPRSNAIPVGDHALQLKADPGPGRILIQQDERRLANAGDDRIHPPVVIQIPERGASVQRGRGDDLGVEAAATSIPQQKAGLPGSPTGEFFRIVVDIAVGSQHIFPSVVVEVICACTPTTVGERGCA